MSTDPAAVKVPLACLVIDIVNVFAVLVKTS